MCFSYSITAPNPRPCKIRLARPACRLMPLPLISGSPPVGRDSARPAAWQYRWQYCPNAPSPTPAPPPFLVLAAFARRGGWVKGGRRPSRSDRGNRC